MNADFKKSYPFSIFKRADRSSFLVSFKDSNGKYLPPVSIKKKTHGGAVQVAFHWLRDIVLDGISLINAIYTFLLDEIEDFIFLNDSCGKNKSFHNDG